MAPTRILVIDGNTEDTNCKQKFFGGSATGEGYAQTLRRMAPDVECIIVRPAYDDYARETIMIDGLDGAVITGSALHVMDATRRVQNQIELVGDVFECEIPVFGSCWGLQLACVVLGGSVRASPNGMEIGVVNDICLTEEGRDHLLFKGKSSRLEVMSIHGDEVSDLPEGAHVLASNNHSPVQALEVIQGGKIFWGVQYHPEYGPLDMAAIYKRYRERFMEQNTFSSRREIDNRIGVFGAMARGGEKCEIDNASPPGLANFESRTREIANWLHWLVRM